MLGVTESWDAGWSGPRREWAQITTTSELALTSLEHLESEEQETELGS